MLRNHKKIIAIIVVIVLIGAGVAAYFVFANQSDNNTATKSETKKTDNPSSHKPITTDPSTIKPGTKGPSVAPQKEAIPASGPSTGTAPKAAN
jgi:hypothetical protein